MHLLLYGPGRLGGAIAAAATAQGWTVTAIGRPTADGTRTAAPEADVVVDASLGGAVAPNVAHALAGVATNLSLGAALFLRLAERAAAWYARAGAFEPSIVEWHRRGKADRPSGTARAIARRIVAADPRWVGPDEAGDTLPGRPELEIAGIRAGAAPGTHLVTFDGPGESVELRLTARDRTAYADGALAASRWLLASPRTAGIHPFDAVVDDLLDAPMTAVPA
jgi:dihydrodipicolinate reductase